ncbi:sensor histidine kinase [Sinomonas sp. JGH33]|uniref:Oxygen sensor histidine kinase NreB n=1 Tax=Sinomonas terricola TaxID=3110330 RepID=A0ABU5T5Z5_9MICC|nr:sensor histidine kinase [Sinomonas sp. JGH33]MEA5455100.1 sensor histidine kinase [Sinomonas sp. JGH33]
MPDSVAARELRAGRPRPIDAVVHASFAVLLVASGARYAMRHSPEENVPVLVLGLAASALYALIALVPAGHRSRVSCGTAVLAAWAALVLLAPSFAWCSLPLFFVFRTVFGGSTAAHGSMRAGHAATAVLAASTAVGLFRLSGWSDLAMLLGPLAAAVLLSLVSGRLEEDAREQARLTATLSGTRAELAESQRRAGAAEERARVSREIHDTVTQGLASSLLLLEAAQRTGTNDDGAAAGRAKVAEAAGLLRESLADTRALVHDLAAPGIDTAPLPEALERAAARYVDRPRLHVSGIPREVPAEIRHALLRVVASAASNVRRHAGPAEVTLSVGFLPDAVTVDVHDSGRGFDPARLPAPSAEGGYGLRAMRQRVEQLGGTFSVESAPGEGTIAAAEVPAPGPGEGAS